MSEVNNYYDLAWAATHVLYSVGHGVNGSDIALKQFKDDPEIFQTPDDPRLLVIDRLAKMMPTLLQIRETSTNPYDFTEQFHKMVMRILQGETFAFTTPEDVLACIKGAVEASYEYGEGTGF